ncbi:MAG: hemolysin III family protein [Trueperaceae bacterium]
MIGNDSSGSGFRLREPVNSITHFVGALLALAGSVVLVVHSVGDPWKTSAFAIYGVTLVLLFVASTLLHALPVTGAAQLRLRILDHAAIFLLIAGSYTPLTLVTLREGHAGWGWSLFAMAWGLALLGVVFKLFWIGAPRLFSTGLYLLMGWLAIVGIVPLVQALPVGGLMWLALGGAFYSVGAIIYGLKQPDPFPGRFGYHEIWHLFVLAGSACHYLLMLVHVLPD